MYAPVFHKIKKQQLWLSADRCIYWEEEKALILSDLHFGKTGHFRKSGIAVPQSVFKEDMQRLVGQIQHFQPKQLLVVGDFFHSNANKELELFRKWRTDFADLVIHLVKGNHDILKNDWYLECHITCEEEKKVVRNFCFIHDITGVGKPQFAKEELGSVNYFFSGHIHPGIRINGAGKQSLSFPCFYFGKKFAVLPAFSRFTGFAMIDPEEHENVFAIVQNKIVQLQ
jgi:DNA ligase-associated metallophosphoesterase